MQEIDFSKYSYCPALLSDAGELLGYSKLGDMEKLNLLPIFELIQRRHGPDLVGPINGIKAAVGSRPFVLDLHKEPAVPPYEPKTASDPKKLQKAKEAFEKGKIAEAAYNAYLKNLKKSDDAFANWRLLVSEFPAAIPILLHSNLKFEFDAVVEQAKILLHDRPIAIRLHQEANAALYSLVSKIITLTKEPTRILVIVDCGQGRTRLKDRAQFAANALSRILKDIDSKYAPQLSAICLSNSFMKPQKEGFFAYENFDRTFWSSTKKYHPFIFGDYGAMCRLNRPSTYVPGEWKATVVYPLIDRWLINRPENTNDPQGWIDGAKAVTNHKDFDPLLKVWGTSVIQKAASGNLSEIDRVHFWHAVKVNLHVHKQLQAAA